MKKIKATFTNLPAESILSRTQMKQIFGGLEEPPCECDDKPCSGKAQGDTCTLPFGGNGKCNYEPCTGCGYYFYHCNS